MQEDIYLKRVMEILQFTMEFPWWDEKIQLREPKSSWVARMALELRDGTWTAEDVERKIEKAIEYDIEYHLHSVPLLQEEKNIIDEVRALVGKKVAAFNKPYMPSEVCMVQGMGGLSEASGSTFFPEIYIFSRKEGEILKHLILHEEFHHVSAGLVPQILDEGMTEYLTLTTMVETESFFKRVSYRFKEHRGILNYYDDLTRRFRWKDRTFYPAYCPALEAILKIVSIAGETPIMEAYLFGKEKQLETILGEGKWGRVVDLSNRYRNIFNVSRSANWIEYHRELDDILESRTSYGSKETPLTNDALDALQSSNTSM